MQASNRAANQTIDLNEFFLRLRKSLLECSKAILPNAGQVPLWAANYQQLLYSDKSIPPELNFSEPGKLYISYLEDKDSVMLIGQSNEKKPIKRKLKINAKRSSSLITISSEHVDFTTGKYFTCTGVGQNLKSALDNYFSCSKLDNRTTFRTDGNVQQEGDAFLLSKVIGMKGNDAWVDEIINAVKKLFLLVPEEKHKALADTIESAISTLDHFLRAGNEKIINFYDARLWLIVDSICKHFDPLDREHDQPRRNLRDHVIAESCNKLMKEGDMTSVLNSYFEAMSMHQEILDAVGNNQPPEACQILVEAYKKDNLYPEVSGHREKIKDYYHRCKKHKTR